MVLYKRFTLNKNLSTPYCRGIVEGGLWLSVVYCLWKAKQDQETRSDGKALGPCEQPPWVSATPGGGLRVASTV